MAKLGHDYLVLPVVADEADIATPAAGSVTLYILESSGLLYQKDETGTTLLISLDPAGTVIPSVASSSSITTPSVGYVSFYQLTEDGNFYMKDSSDGVTQVTGLFTGDFKKDGSVAMTGDLQTGAHAFVIDDIATPSNPASGLFKMYIKSDGRLYILNSSGTETSVTPTGAGTGDLLADGSVAMTADFNLDNHAIRLDDISTPSNPASGKYKIYLKSDGKLYILDSSGAESLASGDFYKDGSIAMTGELQLGANSILATQRSTPSNPSATKYKLYIKSDGNLYILNSSGTETMIGRVGVILADGSVTMTGDLNLDAHALLIDDISTPSNPASGKFKLYLKSDGNLYLKDSSGTEVQLTRTGDFLKDGSVQMTGDLNLDAHALKIDDISTPGNPSAGKFKVYLKSDGNLYLLDSSGSESKLTGTGDFLKNGSVTMTGELDLDAHAIKLDDIGTPSNPSSGKYKLYVKSDGDLYILNSSGTEHKVKGDVAGDFLADGSVAMTGDLQVMAHMIRIGPITAPTSLSGTSGTDYYLYLNATDKRFYFATPNLFSGVDISPIGDVRKDDAHFTAPIHMGMQEAIQLLTINQNWFELEDVDAHETLNFPFHHVVAIREDHRMHIYNDQGSGETNRIFLTDDMVPDLPYEQTTPSDWTSDPSTIVEALDELAARDTGTFTGDAGDVPYTSTTSGDWTEGAPTDVGGALNLLAARESAPFSGDAVDVTFSPANSGDWPEGAPTNIASAADKLAARVGGGGELDYLQILFMGQTGATVSQSVSLDYSYIVLLTQAYA